MPIIYNFVELTCENTEFINSAHGYSMDIDNAELSALVASAATHGACERLGAMLLHIVRVVGLRPEFAQLSYREDLESEALLYIMERISKGLDVSAGDAFNFFYTTARCRFLHSMHKRGREMSAEAVHIMASERYHEGEINKAGMEVVHGRVARAVPEPWKESSDRRAAIARTVVGREYDVSIKELAGMFDASMQTIYEDMYIIRKLYESETGVPMPRLRHGNNKVSN